MVRQPGPSDSLRPSRLLPVLTSLSVAIAACSGGAFSPGAPGGSTEDGAFDGNDEAEAAIAKEDARTDEAAGSAPDVEAGGDVCLPGSGTAGCTLGVDLPVDGLTIWLSADVGTVMVDGLVATWRDRSASHNDASQLTPSYRPSITSDWRAGRPAVRFDGMNDFLAFPSGFDNLSNGLSLFVVLDMTGDASCPSFINLSNGGEIDDISLHRESSDAFGYEVLDQTQVSLPAELPVGTPVFLAVVHRPDQQVRLYAGGALSSEGTMLLPAPVARARNELARSSYSGCALHDGHIAEILLYARSLDDIERARVDRYLKTKWEL
jgi:hypothetical protein